MSQRRALLITIDIFIGLTVVALIAALYLSIARASISIPDATSEYKGTSIVLVGGEGSDVPGSIVTKEYERTTTVPVGDKLVKSDKAGGYVTLVNKSTRNQTLVKTTRLLTPDEKLFRIQQNITVPAGGSVDVLAEADEPGDAFLTGPTKFTIPGLWEGLQDLIYAESSSPMTYDRRSGTVVTQDDVDRAEEKLVQEIKDEAIKEFTDGSYTPRASDITVTRAAISSEPPVSSAGSSVTVTLKANTRALVVDPAALQAFTQDKLVAQLPDPRSFVDVQPDSFTYTIDSVDTDKSQATITANLSAWVKTGGSATPIDLKQLTGKSRRAAQGYLSSKGIQDATIVLSPSWMPTLPLLQSHITITTR